MYGKLVYEEQNKSGQNVQHLYVLAPDVCPLPVSVCTMMICTCTCTCSFSNIGYLTVINIDILDIVTTVDL